MNAAFNAVFGIDLRSSSFFGTGDMAEASKYGDLYNIYPSDDFTAYWSPFIKDLFSLNLSEELLWKEEFAPLLAINSLIADDAELRSPELLNHYLSSMPNVKKFLEKEFPDYMVDYPDSARTTSGKIFNKYPDILKNLYKKGNSLEDLEEAAATKNEVMIVCKFYCWKLL